MKRGLWMSIAAVVVVAAGITLVALPPTPEWTTKSPEALAAFEAATEAQSKVYAAEAADLFKRAHELDPHFVIAKLRHAQFLYGEDSDKAEELFKELEQTDPAGLTARETLFIERWKAYRRQEPEEAERLLDEYVAKNPQDAAGLSIKALVVWNRGQLDDAEILYQRLLKLDPNRVVTYNALGYIAMMQGRFSESEEYFKSYRYIAPDQANPHDSLGELYITIGRYDEAALSLARAIETKADFWASYQHLATMKAMNGHAHEIFDIIDQGRAAGMPDDLIFSLECRARYAEMADREQWELILDNIDDECLEGFRQGYALVMTHRAACGLGDWETAASLESELASFIEDSSGEGDNRDARRIEGALFHLQGVRLAHQGDYEAAANDLRAADDRLTFIEVGDGAFKLYNKTILAEILFAAGEDAEAHKLLANLRRINPELVTELQSSGFRVLGLGRG